MKVDKITESIDSDQMVKKVGGDRITDSCISVVITYVGNILRYDVLDFRGGKNQSLFSINIKQIIKKIIAIREGGLWI